MSDIAESQIMPSKICSGDFCKGDDSVFKSVALQMMCGIDPGNSPAPVF